MMPTNVRNIAAQRILLFSGIDKMTPQQSFLGRTFSGMMLFKTASRSSSVGLVATGPSSITAYCHFCVRSNFVCGDTHGLVSSRRHGKQRPDMRGKGS